MSALCSYSDNAQRLDHHSNSAIETHRASRSNGREVVKAEIASPLNASVAAPPADDCTTLIYRRRRAKRAPESFASNRKSRSLHFVTHPRCGDRSRRSDRTRRQTEVKLIPLGRALTAEFDPFTDMWSRSRPLAKSHERTAFGKTELISVRSQKFALLRGFRALKLI